MDETLLGTKEIIFDTAVELFATIGFEDSNMRDIAQRSGIKAASIYNHFQSKSELLNYIYDYFESHIFDNKKSDSEIQKIIKAGSKEEIFNALLIDFEFGDSKKSQRMLLISKLIYMRIFIDERANTIFLSISLKIDRYIVKSLEYGISINRFKNFDIQTYAYLIVSTKHIIGIKVFSDPDYQVKKLEDDKKLNDMLKDFLPLVATEE